MTSGDAHGPRHAAWVAAAIVAGSALGATESARADLSAPSGRPPAPGKRTIRLFVRANWAGVLELRTSEDGATLAWTRTLGSVPATCRDRRTGRELRAGRDGEVGVNFGAVVAAPIQPDGSFTLTFTTESDSFAEFIGRGLAPTTATISGTFYGNNILGRVQARAGASKKGGAFEFSGCTGNQPFWAGRVDPQ